MTENQFQVDQTVRYEGYQDDYSAFIPAFIGTITKITKYEGQATNRSYLVLHLRPDDWNRNDPQAVAYLERIKDSILAVSASKCKPYEPKSQFIPDQYGDY